MHQLRNGIAGGILAGTVVGSLDFALVLGKSGPFWLHVTDFLEPLAVHGILGAVLGAMIGALSALVPATSAKPATTFRWVAAIVLAIDLSACLVVHIYDVGLPVGSRMQLLPYAAAIGAALAISLILLVSLRAIDQRLNGTTRSHELLTLGVLGAAVLSLLGMRALVPNPPLSSAGPLPSTQAPDIVLVLMDTTRADGLSIYGNPRPTSPELDALGGEGVVFSRAYSTSPWTPPSHASLFTGTYPSTHRTFWQSTTLKPELPTLASALSDLGYETLFASSKSLLNRNDGWTRGFQTSFTVNVEDRVTFLHRRLLDKILKTETATPTLITLVERWMKRLDESDRPAFAFLHLNDPHTTYIEREPFYSEFAEGIDTSSVDRTRLERRASKQDRREEPSDFDPTENAILRARYDSEISFMDAALGRLLQSLRTSGRSRPLVVLLTSDHGELLGEHGLFYHRKYPFEELIHIPFLLWSSDPIEGTASDDLVSLVDVFPTLLDIAGGDPTSYPHLQGRRLLKDSRPEAVFAEHWLDTGETDRSNPTLIERKTAIGDRAKLVWDSTGKVSLYDLNQDAPEQRDAAKQLPTELARLQAALQGSLELESSREVEAVDVDDESLNRLRALGYVD